MPVTSLCLACPHTTNISQDSSLRKKLNECSLSFWRRDDLIFSGNVTSSHPPLIFLSMPTQRPNTESIDVSACGVSLPNQFLLLTGAGGIISMCSIPRSYEFRN